MQPIRFTPWLREMVWGGEKIAPFKGVETAQARIGESWEISGVPGHLSTVAEGPDKGLTIQQLIARDKGKLVGEAVYARYGDEFPLLVKFIDAKSDLLIQVHPDDAMARQLYGPQAKGKTEMWYVIGADEGACLLSGLSEPITPAQYETRIAEGSITDVLARHEIHPGDVYFLPAGRIHAIGAGSFIAEIQQTSDYTYRIFDYNRPGLDGKPRELHTELAKQAIDYTVYPDYKTAYEPAKDREVEVVRCPYFTTSVLDLDAPLTKPLEGLDSFVVLVCVEGSGTLADGEPVFDESGRRGPTKGHLLNLRQGETVLIPATSTGITLTPDAGGMKLVTSWID